MEHKNGAAAPLEENRSPTSRELDERNALLAQELDRAYLHNGRRLDQAVFHSRAEDEDVEAMLHKWLAKQEEEERAGGHSRLTLLLRRLMFWVAVLLLPNLVTLALASTPLGDPAYIFTRHVRPPFLWIELKLCRAELALPVQSRRSSNLALAVDATGELADADVRQSNYHDGDRLPERHCLLWLRGVAASL